MKYEIYANDDGKWEVVEEATQLVVASFWAKSNALIICDELNARQQ